MHRIQAREVRFAAGESRLRALLVQGLQGDAVAYHGFLKELSSHLRAYFRKRLFQRPDDVEDLVQEALLAVHNQRHTYRTDQPLTAWVHAIARYKLVDLLRARLAREELTDPLDDEMTFFDDADAQAAEARKDLDRLLGELPPKQRLPILHVKIEGLSVAETAARTGLSESAVKVGIHRGLKTLAAKMRENT